MKLEMIFGVLFVVFFTATLVGYTPYISILQILAIHAGTVLLSIIFISIAGEKPDSSNILGKLKYYLFYILSLFVGLFYILFLIIAFILAIKRILF